MAVGSICRGDLILCSLGPIGDTELGIGTENSIVDQHIVGS